MAHIEAIAPLDEFRNREADNYITLRAHPDDEDLLIANYTPFAVYAGAWDAVTLASRGLIFRASTGYLVARPLRKFFNYNQPQGAALDMSGRIEVADKEDGSLGILYRAPDGRLSVATRGSMASRQALHATEVFRDRYERIWAPDEDYTFLFEIVYPEGRVVIDYDGMDDLILLGAVHKATGRSVDRAGLESFGWPGPTAKAYLFDSIEEVFKADQERNREGFVIHLVESDERVKVKFAEYLRIHGLLFDLSERRVWEMLSSGDDLDNWLMEIPDEFTTEARRWRDGLRGRFQHYMESSAVLHAELEAAHGEDRKAIAQSIRDRSLDSLTTALVFGRFSGWSEDRLAEATWKGLRV